MKDNTSNMISLLGKMRKQMNGAVADSMFYYGQDYGLNYGVSLPTIRSIAKEWDKDHEFALYLLRQQVRELKLAAMHIAKPEMISIEEAQTWANAIINSEIAEECAFALLSQSPMAMDIYKLWIASENEYVIYAALMTAARNTSLTTDIIAPINDIVNRYPDSRPIAHGVVAVLANAYSQASLQECVKTVIAQLNNSNAAQYIREEMSWRIEFN
ncbi:MAG: DNA alkylation repair protein [Alistipes sp.]|nr:DNA alkylation repair protein [Alistipes sp.]MBO7194578.1 DNA alkylation repair protein [Alistipes sp.]